MFERVFIDANIFIDLHDHGRGNLELSLKLLDFLTEQNISIYTSCDLISTIYYILAKKDKNLALTSIEQLNTICKVIEFGNKEITTVCRLMREDLSFKDFEDTLQYVLALNKSCELIISNDQNFFSPEIQKISSSEFVERFIK